MTIADWLMIGAVLAGPIIAVQLTRFLDNKREIRDRKLNIFKTLMETRAYRTSWSHVIALNRIDLEFDGGKVKEKEVIDAWKAYLDILGDRNSPIEQLYSKRIDLFVELLYKMAQVLDYDFDKTHIKNSSYSPVAHGDIDKQWEELRCGFIDVLNGKKVIPMYVTNLPPQQAQQESLEDEQNKS